MSSTAPTIARHRAAEPASGIERIATLAELDLPGRHAAPEGAHPIYDALHAELAAVDWFSLDH